MNKSLVRQLLVRLSIATGLALVATIGLLVWQFENSTQIALDRGLGDTLEEIRANLELDDQGNLVDTLSEEFKARFNDEFFSRCRTNKGLHIIRFLPGTGITIIRSSRSLPKSHSFSSTTIWNRKKTISA